jgi:hypothetical protein
MGLGGMALKVKASGKAPSLSQASREAPSQSLLGEEHPRDDEFVDLAFYARPSVDAHSRFNSLRINTYKKTGWGEESAVPEFRTEPDGT